MKTLLMNVHAQLLCIIVVLQGRRKRSGWSGFGPTTVYQGENEIHFAKSKQKHWVIIGLVKLVILQYSR